MESLKEFTPAQEELYLRRLSPLNRERSPRFSAVDDWFISLLPSPASPLELLIAAGNALAGYNVPPLTRLTRAIKRQWALRWLRFMWILTDPEDLTTFRHPLIRDWKWGDGLYPEMDMILLGTQPRSWACHTILEPQIDAWTLLTERAFAAMEDAEPGATSLAAQPSQTPPATASASSPSITPAKLEQLSFINRGTIHRAWKGGKIKTSVDGEMDKASAEQWAETYNARRRRGAKVGSSAEEGDDDPAEISRRLAEAQQQKAAQDNAARRWTCSSGDCDWHGDPPLDVLCPRCRAALAPPRLRRRKAA